MELLPVELVLRIGLHDYAVLSCVSTQIHDIFTNTKNQLYMMRIIENLIDFDVPFRSDDWSTQYPILLNLAHYGKNWLRNILNYLPPVRLLRMIKQSNATCQIKNKVLVMEYIKSIFPSTQSLSSNQLDELWYSLETLTPIDIDDWQNIVNHMKIDYIHVVSSDSGNRKQKFINDLLLRYNRTDPLGLIYRFCINRSLRIYTNIPHKNKFSDKIKNIKLYLIYQQHIR